ncbi:membrane metallo-endopeptidase-like 1 [Panonychus citri]|uniref:membrane metallo-endopeptidase-like 1 n=1 Tax=Panonychus citri TaxID=50023 RepID=UPI002306DDD2|nr:membrane metallo-endopeptidase-like 1 [Panonychus citri]XP_053211744.1 membrane metallo-endopeptidase-like 1 [Panonychus citri]
MGKKWVYAIFASLVLLLLVILLVAKSGNENRKIGICRSEGCKASGKQMLKYLDKDADPCNDLYQLACGKWIILEKPRNYSIRDELEETLIKQVKTLLGTSLVRSPVPVQLASTFYKNCLDAAPYYAAKWLDEELQDIGGWPLIANNQDETTTISEDGENNGDSDETINTNLNWTDSYVKARTEWNGNWIIGMQVIVNPKYKTKYIIKIDLPERSTIWDTLINEDNSTEINNKIDEYKNSIRGWVEKMGRKRGQMDNQLIDEMIKFETELAKAHKNSMSDKSEDKFMSLGELIETSPDRKIPWESLLRDVFANVNITLTKTEPILLSHQSYYQRLDEIIATTSNKVITTYIGWKFVSQYGGHLNDLPVDEKARESYCLRATFQHYSHALKRLYVEKYFDSTSKNRVGTIVKTIKQYLINNLKTLSMADKDREMRNRIKRKLEKIETLVGYDDWIAKKDKVEDYYSDIPDYADRKYLGSIVDVVTGQTFKELRRLRQKFSKQIPNPDVPGILSMDAFFDQETLKLVYSPGLLQTPIFNADAPLPINYGAIGSIIGRDLISSIDLKGSEIDESGAKRNWWTTKASTNYHSYARCFDNVYDSIVGWNNRSLEQVIRDVEGLRIAFEAFNDLVASSRDVRIPKDIKNYSLEQIFFISYAQMFCANDKADKVPINFIVKQFAPFNEAFKCKKTNNIKKCRL